MSYLKLEGAGTVVKARATYALGKCADKDYPKKAGEVSVTVDGKPAKIAVTTSRVYSTAATTGCNGYIRLNGFTAWIAFDSGFVPTAGMKFSLVEGKAPDANPVRVPKNPASEANRVKLFKEWAEGGGFSKVKPAAGEEYTEV